MAEPSLSFPLRNREIAVTTDPDHYRSIDLSREVMIPLPPHPGAFGVTRKHHVHEGVDLYCPAHEPIYAMEAGHVVAIIPFTGLHAGSPWWEDTFAVLVSGASGVINYGEIAPAPELVVGQTIERGSKVGTVLRVLREDKGRPREMLHLELYKHGTTDVVEWRVGEAKPEGLLDPTLMLRAAT